MNKLRQTLGAMLLGVAVATSAANVACAVHGEARIRYYDREHEDWHQWDNHEEDRYRVYLKQRHQEYRDFRSLDDGEKRNYWNWRHNQNDGGTW